MIAALIQPDVLEPLQASLDEIFELIDQAAVQQAELVILPELWNTPFINERILTHADDGRPLLQALKAKAAELKIWLIAGTIPWKEEGRLFNACFVLNPDGQIEAAAKKLHLLEVHTEKHTYRESDVFTPGNGIVSFDSPWGKIGIVICYDLRFPEVSRLLSEDCFLLAAVCGFNAAVGEKHWQPLLQARAIENEVFVCGVNPAAGHFDSYNSYGHSMVISPDGAILASLNEKRGVCLCRIDPEQVRRIRRRSPYWKLRRQDLYSLERKH